MKGSDDDAPPLEGQAAFEDLSLHLSLPHTRLSRRLDGLVDRVAGWTGALWVALLAVIVVNVALRYVFGAGRIEFEEIQWHLYAVGFLFGMSECVRRDSHIRVDFLRERFSPRMQAWIDLYGILLLLFPFLALVVLSSLPWLADSYTQGEVSPSPGGLPFRWLMKAVVPVAMLLLGAAALSRLSRLSSLLFGAPVALADADSASGSDPRRR